MFLNTGGTLVQVPLVAALDSDPVVLAKPGIAAAAHLGITKSGDSRLARALAPIRDTCCRTCGTP
jgi:hypothetical protein